MNGKINKIMKKAGIWLDSKQAFIVTLTPNGETVEKIISEIDFFNRTSTAGPRVKWGGTQNVTQERTYLEKEKKQFKDFFRMITEALSEVDELVLFGPADINKKFKKELLEHYEPLAKKLTAIVKADSLTVNQTKALVRDFFRRK